ncbi:MAG: transcription-repair coupling factor, partial [Chloroflexales bacterium]
MIRVLGYNRFGAFIGAKTRSFSVLCWLMTNTNPLAAITTELADMADVAHIAESLAGSAVHLRVAPLPSAARTPLVAALARHARAPMLYITINAEAALRAADDLRQWLGPEAVLLYPASDSMPYEHMSPGDEVIARRLRVLQALPPTPRLLPPASCLLPPASCLLPPVIVSSVKALLQPTLTPEELANASTTLRLSQELSQDTLLRTLIGRGYRPASAIAAPGELSRRGGIIDVWPSSDERPLRIEFFGDEIDSLRRFDPATQRSDQRVDHAQIGPSHEIPLWNRDLALTRIAALDLSGLRRETRAEWDSALARLDLGERFEGHAFYAPFFRDPTTNDRQPTLFGGRSSLLAHLPPGSTVLLSEGHMLAHHAAEIAEHAETQRRKLIDQGELPPGFPRPYLTWEGQGAGSREQGAGGRRQEGDDKQDYYSIIDLSNNENITSLPPASCLLPPTFAPAELFGGQFRRLVADIVARLKNGERVVAITSQAPRLQELVEEGLRAEGGRLRGEDGAHLNSALSPQPSALSPQPSAFTALHGALEAGWRLPVLGLTLYTDAEIFGVRQRRLLSERRSRSRSAEDRAAFLRGLKVGDYVVHIEHGIAVYEGLIRRTVGEIEREYLVLRYAASDKIYVPVDQIDRVARYIGAGDSAPTLTRLGTQDWERAKRKARAAVQDLAQDLLALYAQRQTKRGYAFSRDNEWQRELEGSFPYIETDDQLRALVDVKADMEHDVPMDRLICGDVGFGKTEVALRAAFKAVQDGKQVAILVPTTVLAQQHFDTFSRRMTAFPVVVEMLSRFRSAKEQDVILQNLARGRVDIIIGTHRLLSKDVSFKDLGLVVVDEEQRFGVRHKERLKHLRAEVDVLTLTATPIPRTLHMAMAGIRDMSVIDTPPEDRVPIKTYVLPYDEALIREAILRELEREGQIYFVHNRVQSIYHVASHLRNIVPEANVGVGHGQLDERELERVMLDFFEGRHDVLVCTTIIESGLDVPNANTIIIDDATNYGLAQLYQLRGRVGRSTNRAYAYLFYKRTQAMTEEAQQRLEAIQEATELGAGFRVAMRDLEIRGAGNLLGAEQSGHIAAVGFDLYSRLLEQAVGQLKQQGSGVRGQGSGVRGQGSG